MTTETKRIWEDVKGKGIKIGYIKYNGPLQEYLLYIVKIKIFPNCLNLQFFQRAWPAWHEYLMREQNLPQIIAKLPNHWGEHPAMWLNWDDDNETYLEDFYMDYRAWHLVP